MSGNPEPYDERIRLAEIVGDARKLLANPVFPRDWPAYCGQLEATLKALADSAEIVAQARFA